MDGVEACCIIKTNGDGTYTLMPRKGIDRTLLEGFVNPERGRIVNVRVMNRAQAKTYDQTKTFWALLSYYYRSITRSYPTSQELKWFYDELLKDLFPVRPSITKEDQWEPKHWSELTKGEGIEVISKMVTLVSEQNHVPDEIRASVKDIFEWLQQEKGEMWKDPTDYHEDGTPLTTEEWAEANRICMCTGTYGGDLCHIVSRGEGKGLEWLVNQPWNYYRARHDIHLDIQHGISWEAVFTGVERLGYVGAPWLRKRYERARRMFDEGRAMFHNGYSKEDVLKYLSYSDCKQNDAKVEKTFC